MEKYKSKYKIAITAHRGASGLVKFENTLESYAKAIELNVDSIECDVRKTKDNVIIMNHNPDIDGMMIADYTYEELEKKCNEIGYHLPTLKETLLLCKNKMILDIEIKEVGYEDELYKIISSIMNPDEYYIRSFYDDAIIAFKKLNPNIKTVLLLGLGKPQHLIRTRLSEFFPKKRILKTNCDFVSPYIKMLDFGVAKRIHKLDKQVLVWTVNTEKDMLKCKKKKCEGIITNYPNIALDILEK